MSEPQMKLYVVGESSGNPDDWSEWGGYSIVLAQSPEDAIDVAGSLCYGHATLVDMTRKTVVAHISSFDPKD